MKKLVIGCGLALVLFAIAASAGFYYFVYRPARTFLASVSQIGELAELDAKVANTRPFAAPGDDTLTEAQVRRFVAVQESLHTRMGTRATELQAKYKAIDERKDSAPAISEVVGAYRDLFGIIGDAKRAQVDALNAQSFSVDEYTWVKSRFYEAAGVTVTGIDFREMADKVKDGNLGALQEMITNAGATLSSAKPDPDAAAKAPADAPADAPATIETDTPGVGIPEVNKTLVAPFKDKATTWMIYAAFGL